MPWPAHPLLHGPVQRAAVHLQRAGRPLRGPGHRCGPQHLGPFQHLPRGGIHPPAASHPTGSGATPGPSTGDHGGDPLSQPAGTGPGREPVQQRLVLTAAGSGAQGHVQRAGRPLGGRLADDFSAPLSSRAPSAPRHHQEHGGPAFILCLPGEKKELTEAERQ